MQDKGFNRQWARHFEQQWSQHRGGWHGSWGEGPWGRPGRPGRRRGWPASSGWPRATSAARTAGPPG